MNRITIEGVELDLYKSDNINFNVSINKLQDVTNRNSSYSNTFEIPRTSKNENIFDFAGVMGNQSNTPYISHPCRYYIDTTAIISNGTIKLLETTPNNYRVAVYDGIIDLSLLLGDSLVSDLDYSGFDHFLSAVTDATGTFNNDWTDGYIYAVGEFGKSTAGAIAMQQQAPSVFAKWVMNEIFESRGLTVEGSFWSSNTDFEELLIPPTKGIEITADALTRLDIGTGSTATLNINNTTFSGFDFLRTDLEFTSNSFDVLYLSVDGNGDIAFDYTGHVELNPTFTYTETDTDLSVEMYVNGVLNSATLITTASPFTMATKTISVTPTTVVNYKVRSSKSSPYPPANWNHVYTASLSVQVDATSGGTLIQMQNYMSGELSQKDLLKDVIQRFNLVMVRDANNPLVYSLVEMETLLSDRDNAVDWSSRVMSFYNENYASNYAQTNKGVYRYPTDVVPTHDGEMLISNTNLPIEKIILSAPYEIPNPHYLTIGGETIYRFPIWELIPDTSPAEYTNVTTTNKLMRLTSDTTAVPFSLFGAGAVYPNPWYYLGLADMGYTYFFNTYYPLFKDMVDHYKAVDVELNLTLIDYTALDLTKLVFLKQTGRFYYIDSIRLTEKSAKAKLIEIRNI